MPGGDGARFSVAHPALFLDFLGGRSTSFGPKLSVKRATMRVSRFSVLSKPTGIVHLFWRCHNREYLLDRPDAKKLFFQSLIFGLGHRGSDSSVKLHAFCLMGNHVHKQMSFRNGAIKLSHFMRVANGRFGQLFNKKFERSGKVANERPKTPLIGDTESQMRVHFYIEANPIRANKRTFENLRFDLWNSYRYYAHGEVDEVTKHLTPPEWYLALGSSSKERQRSYRKLFLDYLERSLRSGAKFLKRFIGTALWMKDQEVALKALLKEKAMALAHASPS